MGALAERDCLRFERPQYARQGDVQTFHRRKLRVRRRAWKKPDVIRDDLTHSKSTS